MATQAQNPGLVRFSVPDAGGRVRSARAVLRVVAVAAAPFKPPANRLGIPRNWPQPWVFFVPSRLLSAVWHRQPNRARAHSILPTALTGGLVPHERQLVGDVSYRVGGTRVETALIASNGRRHEARRHGRSVQAIVSSALPVVGMFTFPFDRGIGH